MPTPPPRLSKSRVQSGAQCALRLWNDCFARELAEPVDEIQQFIFDRGTRIGELARERYSGGRLIEAEYDQTEIALEQTEEALSDRSVDALFEPALTHRGVIARIDVLRRAPSNRWDLIEVKGAANRKDVYLRDLAIQLWIARGAGVGIRRAGLLLLNKEYVFDGRQLDLDQLFAFVDLTDEALAMQGEIAELVSSLQAVVSRKKAPVIEPGDQCYSPYECPYLAKCTEGYEALDHPIASLPRISANKLLELEQLGVEEIHEIPADFELNEKQARVRDAVITGEAWVSDGLAAALADITYPVHHLDFETVMPPVPIYAGTRPFEQVPILYSIHREREDGAIEHCEHLCRGLEDPHRELAERLLSDLGGGGSICVYSPFEKTTIKRLATRLPDLAPDLEALVDRIWDLLPVVRSHYYHPGFQGSYSIKKVLPALVPGANYDDNEIADGRTAAMKFEIALMLGDGAEREEIFGELRRYCEQDTWAMVELRRALGGVVG